MRDPRGASLVNGHSAGADEMRLQMGAHGGEPEALLLIGAPTEGRVRVRRWSGHDWSALPEPHLEDAVALLEWIEAQAAAGRSLTQSLYGLRLWLRGEGDEFRTR